MAGQICQHLLTSANDTISLLPCCIVLNIKYKPLSDSTHFPLNDKPVTSDAVPQLLRRVATLRYTQHSPIRRKICVLLPATHLQAAERRTSCVSTSSLDTVKSLKH